MINFSKPSDVLGAWASFMNEQKPTSIVAYKLYLKREHILLSALIALGYGHI